MPTWEHSKRWYWPASLRSAGQYQRSFGGFIWVSQSAEATREGKLIVARQEHQSVVIRRQFESLCQKKTGYPELNDALIRLYEKREEFLAVLDHPHLALHNNLSENDIREYARLRKISGGTRSTEGRRCRDTFMSLKKTCRKLGVNFQAYLRDRIRGRGEIPLLADLMRKTAAEREIAPASQ